MKRLSGFGRALFYLALLCGPRAMAEGWTLSAATNTNWRSVACSADGTVVVATGYSGVYVSTNSGATWDQTGPTAQPACTASADGRILAAAGYGQGIYVSTNSGASWLLTSAPAGEEWSALTCAADGSTMAAAVFGYGAGFWRERYTTPMMEGRPG